jgi:hypothetical protein
MNERHGRRVGRDAAPASFWEVPQTILPVRGGFEAMCGGCLKYSKPVSAETPDGAWPAIEALGWALHKNNYALCPVCTKDPPNVDKDAARAMRRRKRK